MNYMRTLVYNLIEILHSIRRGVGEREGEGGGGGGRHEIQ